MAERFSGAKHRETSGSVEPEIKKMAPETFPSFVPEVIFPLFGVLLECDGGCSRLAV